MNDLLDLNWSSGPSSQPALQPDKPKTNAFDLLSKPSSPTYLSSAPLRATPSPSPAFGRPASQSPLSNSSPKTAASTSAPSRVATPAADAFSNLLSLPATAGPSKSLTIAERQAQLAREKQEAANREREQFAVDGAFWNRFGGDSGPSLAPAPVLAPAGKATNGLDDLLQPTPRSAQLRPTSTASGTGSQLSPQPPKNAGTFWDLQPDAEASPAPTATPDPWDFDALPASTPAASKPASGMRTPVSNFDFNERDNDDGDLLGDLGKPARPKPAQPAPSAVRSSSPPPHVVGKIVEMGFTPAQARGALAKTDTGVNVEAAIELLLGGQSHTMADVEVEDHHVERERRRREDERRRHAARRAGPSRDSVQARPRNSPRQPAEHEPVDTFSETTDRLVAQATEIGSSAWSKATSLWNSSKERTIKAIEEQRKAMEQRDRPKDGRPRWMVGAEALEDGRRDGEAGSFTNDAPLEDRERPRQATRPIRRDTRDAPDARSSKEADLLSAEPPKTYVSPFRHGKKPPHSAPITRVTSPAPPLITRQLVSATPAQISASVSHQAKGNDHFKLGRFAEAESAYSSAISSLPERHLLLVPLHNNRAAARLKLGDSGPAAADCSTVLDLVGPLYHPSKEAPLPAEFADVKLADALAKALVKRAQAYEMGEKWKDALADWERVLGLDAAFGSSHKALAADGVRRAKRAIEGDAPAQSRPAPRPIKVAPSKPADVSKSAAVGELRKAAKAQEAEDDLRAAHKDAVDAKLLAWKAGKETNLRALIASLSTVLWDDIMAGGLKVGMHELITDKQVKMKYMKVVARLHPDKLNASNTTVEQRMLANGAFGTLSEATTEHQPNMQAQVQAAAPVPVAPVVALPTWPSLAPAPFILLFLLPALPLLLFSIGARPPDTSALPFSTDDMYHTMALMCAAGAVVLCLGVYPDAFGGVWGWVRDGAWPADAGGGVDAGSYAPAGQAGNIGHGEAIVRREPGRVEMEEHVEWRRTGAGPHVEQAVQVGTDGAVVARQAVTAGHAGVERVVRRRWGLGPDVEYVHVPLDARIFADPAARHVAYLRESAPLSKYYSRQPPDLGRCALGGLLGLALVVLGVGRWLRGVYLDDEARAQSKHRSRDKDRERKERARKEKERQAKAQDDGKGETKDKGKSKGKNEDGKKHEGASGKDAKDGAGDKASEGTSGDGPERSGQSKPKKPGLVSALKAAFAGPPGPAPTPTAPLPDNAVVVDAASAGVEMVDDDVAMMAREKSRVTAEAAARAAERR